VNVLVSAERIGFADTGEQMPPHATAYKQFQPQIPLYRLQFQVCDTGIGIPLNRIHRLFKSFTQADASIARRYGGTGLGLVISKRLCEMMGGCIWVESQGYVSGQPPIDFQPQSSSKHKPNPGSTFYFTITAPALPRTPRIEVLEPDGSLIHKRLLIVSDHPLNQKLLTVQAQIWQSQVISVKDSTAALIALQHSTSFDIVIYDRTFSACNESDLIQKVRALPKYKFLPFIVLQSVGNQLSSHQAQLDRTIYLSKPIREKALHTALLQALKGQSEPIDRLALSALSPSSTDTPPLAVQIPLRILTVDDITVNQKIVLQMLQKLGYRADVANNGKEAIESVCRQPYDLVLMDVQMPGVDGVEATQKIRQHQKSPTSPWIIAVTAHAMSGDRERCIRAGMNDYLTKPISLEGLVRAIRRYAEVHPQAFPIQPVHTSSIAHKRSASEQSVDALPANSTMLPAPIDYSILEELRQIAGEEADQLIAELIQSYRSDSLVALTHVQQSIEQSDDKAIKQSVHALRSMSLNIGAVRLGELCKALEVDVTTMNFSKRIDLLAQIKAEYDRVKAALQI
jgi:CheY-like chemotaxis protein/HPt (histidine-containing phosphotransfer) domain-containing protein